MHLNTRSLVPLLIPGLIILAACSHSRNTETEAKKDQENSRAQAADSARMSMQQSHQAVQDDPPAPPSDQTLAPTGSGGQQLPSDAPMGQQNNLPPTGGAQRGSLPSEAPSSTPSLPPTGNSTSGGGRATLPSEGGSGSGQTGRAPSEMALAALRSESGFEQVTVSDGANNCLILGGSVHTAEKKMQAESLAKSAAGTSCVKNGIAVVK